MLGLADVAGVEPQLVHAGVERRERQLVLVVDVGDDRQRRAGHDPGQALGRLGLVARATDDVAAGAGQRVDLRERAVDVGRLGGRHRLDADRGVAADGDLADLDLTGAPPLVPLGHCPNGLRSGSARSSQSDDTKTNTMKSTTA